MLKLFFFFFQKNILLFILYHITTQPGASSANHVLGRTVSAVIGSFRNPTSKRIADWASSQNNPFLSDIARAKRERDHLVVFTQN